MRDLELHERLTASEEPFGALSRRVVWGDESVLLQGLDEPLARALARRWGAFLVPVAAGDAPPDAVELQLLRGGPGPWIAGWADGGLYRLEARNDAARRVIVSHHYALGRGASENGWRLGVCDAPAEPLERIVDNALRFVIAARALQLGGFAMHAAGVLRDGQAHLFAGASGAGKTTAVALAGPVPGLGDDFGVVVRRDDAWFVPALPFDNTERVAQPPPRGWLPLGGVWRLRQATTTYVERPSTERAIASLLGCAAFPWAMPERGEALLESVGRLVADGRFAHLHFERDADLWTVLI